MDRPISPARDRSWKDPQPDDWGAQIERYRRDTARFHSFVVNQAEALLTEYERDARCPKCDFASLTTSYEAAWYDGRNFKRPPYRLFSTVRESGDVMLMRRACPNCGGESWQKPKDWKKP